MKFRSLSPCALGLLLALSAAAAPTPPPELVPARLILNPTAEPATSMAVTWRTDLAGTNPAVQFAESTPGTGFKTQVATLPARTEPVTIDTKEEVFYHSAVIAGLKPATPYVYRVGTDAAWSEWNQFKTAARTAAPFTFVYLGDPQDDIKEHVTRIFRAADQLAPAAAFWLIAGDLTSEPEDAQVRDLYAAAGYAFRTRPILPVAGNHDLAYVYDQSGKITLNAKGKKARALSLPPTWRAQFTLPENGLRGFEESCYQLDYQGVRLIVLNSNDRLAGQAAWLEPLLANNPNHWTIVAFHHPLYSTGRERDDRETRDALRPLFDRYHVDLVLTGHDHSYGRTHALHDDTPVGPGEPGTVYVTSTSGPKFYAVNAQYGGLMAKMAGGLQLFQKITITGDVLSFTSIAANGEINDTFELVKK